MRWIYLAFIQTKIHFITGAEAKQSRNQNKCTIIPSDIRNGS